jgi:THO complex subunit 1
VTRTNNDYHGGLAAEYKLTADRIILPDAEVLVKDVQAVELDLDMAFTDEEKQQLQESKTSKTWRALRLASKTKLSLFDQVDDGQNLQCLVQSQGPDSNIEGGEYGGGGDDRQPEEATVEVA